MNHYVDVGLLIYVHVVIDIDVFVHENWLYLSKMSSSSFSKCRDLVLITMRKMSLGLSLANYPLCDARPKRRVAGWLRCLLRAGDEAHHRLCECQKVVLSVLRIGVRQSTLA